ncbi:MAG: transcriptional regulator [Halobacteriota archaeon]
MGDTVDDDTLGRPFEGSIDRTIHQPTRLRIVSHLYEHGRTLFTELTTALSITPGNLESHGSRLESEDCLAVEKRVIDRRPRTAYRLTATGADRFRAYQSMAERITRIPQAAAVTEQPRDAGREARVTPPGPDRDSATRPRRSTGSARRRPRSRTRSRRDR